MAVSLANIAIWKLIDNTEAQDTEDYRVTCDDCATMIDEDTYDSNDGLCPTCDALVHFTCSECNETFHTDDHSEYGECLCTECGIAKQMQEADELWAEIEDLAGSWSGEDNEISNLRKLLNLAKKLS